MLYRYGCRRGERKLLYRHVICTVQLLAKIDAWALRTCAKLLLCYSEIAIVRRITLSMTEDRILATAPAHGTTGASASTHYRTCMQGFRKVSLPVEAPQLAIRSSIQSLSCGTREPRDYFGKNITQLHDMIGARHPRTKSNPSSEKKDYKIRFFREIWLGSIQPSYLDVFRPRTLTRLLETPWIAKKQPHVRQ
ncbi:hypothetical protein L873DRAFT_595551 [Choiromyces venosus 120613-1]|uniref:Uncharacterized protein n=1 Tax=Choiromyces venosus 120613-1 TaxID=1336337 RepID=A0A3N4JTQ8_9PEZI|nr:hypothetical protein L873DRAFT_595551 [Choiromyces venosus 120613-1]